MIDQPKPTGEWTVDELVECVNGVGYKELARRINAALTSEREKVHRAAKEWTAAKLESETFYKDNAELEHQLAAAQLAIANHNRDNNNANGTCYKIKADTTALDAALSAAQQPLTECLNWLRGELKGDEYYVEKIDIAFVKVKETQ